MSLPQCASGQHPWKLLYQGAYDLTTGLTPTQACQNWADSNLSWSFVSLIDNVCLISSPSYGEDTAQAVPVCLESAPSDPPPTTCTGACTITVQLDATVAVQQLRAEVIAQIQDPSLIGLDSGDVAQAYAWAFASVLVCFLLGWLVSVAVGLVRKV